MAPPAARQRYNANKSDNGVGLTKKPPRKLDSQKKDCKKSSNGTKISYTAAKNTKSTIVPSVETAFKTFVSARLCSAIWAYISDCDETFNYWEPLHYIINGHGMQTWEYSPQFALRSYTYLLLQGVPGWIYQKLFNPSPFLIFYMIRCILGFGCAVMERFMYKSICQEFGIHIGRLWLIFQLFSVGMFVSSTALLPSSFSMYFGCAAIAAWWQLKYSLAIFFVAISAILGWPFAGLLGVPVALDMLLHKRMWKTFITWASISAITIGLPMVAIDSTYFGKLVIAPLNLVIYNVFTSHGPNIFGTEPLKYYLFNGFLNFNVIWLLSLITPVMLVIDHFLVPAKSKSTLNFPRYLSLAPLYLWLLVFFPQPHKEERFLFPIYPLISLCGAITVDVIQRIFFRLKSVVNSKTMAGSHYLDHTMFIAVFVMLVSTLLGLSRVFSLYRNYHAPMDVFMELNQFKASQQYKDDRIYNVCIGKDWYRYPGSFFFPTNNFRLRFLKSEFRGMLPFYYADGENATQVVHPYFNDINQENESAYFVYNDCDFLIYFDEGKYTDLEPNYTKFTKDWIPSKTLPFLIPHKSHKLFRAFYIPFLTDNYTSYGSFYLLKRKIKLS
ncbi:LOW QUALITY PROTEIN: alpha-1,2-mannosyltransferase ALG9-like [Rhagoletis pomonella]|uniref:LOW QUALITY PROTEIN: alpha-1,2-mannosyltransferase ALG9-like n=1 Tax=Rhagoletis pomonella TaxID=28610 RepID=UPI00177E557D|nr:LOW QUALITY PROTEIN: alpha-1,2-mannosyltransferase ALG9-like [Rhagoletis pomonella]XP_036345186.1 LOW QUALITY PROTEIN: alpha-1,2-mannosyltransferase ALG9-like [Rhagoletis pomonella]